MTTLKVAHVREQGVDLIIVPLDQSFDQQSSRSQSAAIGQIRRAAVSAGLAGTVVPMWPSGNNVKFVAPPNWHPFFRTLSFQAVLRSINKEIRW